LSKEVESVFDMRDAGLLGRELQAPVSQKLLNQWFDFVFQQFLGCAGDDEVITPASVRTQTSSLTLTNRPATYNGTWIGAHDTPQWRLACL
jgi:hypothetical protein